jgi:hypothetical protein
LDDVALLRKALLVVALSFLLYNIYQATVATLFISHFPFIVTQLPKFIESSQPNLQVGLFLFQELAATAGSYLRLIGAVFALSATVLFFRKNTKYLNRFRWALLFESLYFALLFPAALNHIVGSVISSSAFLNFYTGVSNLLQATLIFPPLFILSRKLKNPKDVASILKWAGIAATLYVLGFWVRNGLLWVYAISPAENPQMGIFESVGFVNSLLTLLLAAVVCAMVFLDFKKKNKRNIKLSGVALILMGIYFLIYDLVAIWNPVYRAFLPLTDFWMISLLVLGVALLVDSGKPLMFR